MGLMKDTWMTRSLGEDVSALMIHEGGVIAGGYEGLVRYWDSEGELLWTSQCDSRVSDFAIKDNTLYATCGLDITALDLGDGELLWREVLEGSSDSLVVRENDVIVSTSVYDLEHYDFLESAIWSFDFDGKLNWVHRMDERPWCLFEFNGQYLAGLGRPKTGILSIGPDGVEHGFAASPSPIMCGLSGRERALFGHSDGSVSTHDLQVLCKEEDSVTSLVCIPEGFVSATENGLLVARDSQGEMLWSAKGMPIQSQVDGFSINGANTHWSMRWMGMEGVIEVVESKTGESLIKEASYRMGMLASDGDRVAIGFDDGKVCVWQQEMLERRMNSSKKPGGEDSARRSALAEKLRALRDR